MMVRRYFWAGILVAAATALVMPSPTMCANTRHGHKSSASAPPPPPPRAPRWLRPDKMTREVYAEPVNSAVSEAASDRLQRPFP